MTESKQNRSAPITPPRYRRLRILLDPSLSLDVATAAVNRATAEVPWENLAPGPKGEYVEVIDHDPASGCFYQPVDLSDPLLLAQDGHIPSAGNPQFHQQMVYAVSMMTIRSFERALGRVALWKGQKLDEAGQYINDPEVAYVPRLRIFPHALREANAYYSPDKQALLFGYFSAPADIFGNQSGGTVFTCQSFDIIAHETTHALLDGLHPRFGEATNEDMLAFHEAFADVVALLQHFTFPDFLRQQIGRTRGDIASDNRLAQLAREFGESIGNYGALRDAIGKVDVRTGKWERLNPDPKLLADTHEPHARGAILVAAVFDAFLAIYQARTEDLLRLATRGTGVLEPGAIPPDLVNRLSAEAAKSARHVLNICIRALDYCPPVDLTFGDYLRAAITADFDAFPEDRLGYRVALVQAFLKRGIFPRDVHNRADVDGLRWQPPTWELDDELVPTFKELSDGWDLNSDRRSVFTTAWKHRAKLHVVLDRFISSEAASYQAELRQNLGLMADQKFEIHSARPARRRGPDGEFLMDLVLEIVQTVMLDPETLEPLPRNAEGMKFRGGCTLLIDMRTGKIRYCIRKSISNRNRRREQATFLTEAGATLAALYLGPQTETFAKLHRGGC